MAETTMAATAMHDLVRDHAAEPLLAGAEVGPTWYAGSWWYVPSEAPDDADYQRADPDLSREFDALRRRAGRIAEASGEGE
jgi:hypothetical protein